MECIGNDFYSFHTFFNLLGYIFRPEPLRVVDNHYWWGFLEAEDKKHLGKEYLISDLRPLPQQFFFKIMFGFGE